MNRFGQTCSNGSFGEDGFSAHIKNPIDFSDNSINSLGCSVTARSRCSGVTAHLNLSSQPFKFEWSRGSKRRGESP
ncbi:hypothetical protein evm_000194 [Chilo suppressalis]|nr:hypothetical protein evm_000194 [Chilo suppressalis]